MPEPIEQKYSSAYYAYKSPDYHYVIFQGIRSRHSSQDEALQLCEQLNERYGLPHVNVYKSSMFGDIKLRQKKNQRREKEKCFVNYLLSAP